MFDNEFVPEYSPEFCTAINQLGREEWQEELNWHFVSYI
jgi:hypothetical protein